MSRPTTMHLLLLAVLGGTSCDGTAPGPGGSPGGLALVTTSAGIQPDNDGYLVPTAHTFQEGGMHVEGWWVPNNNPAFSPLGHLHIHFQEPWERSHGAATTPGGGPDRQGIFFRREDGGPFDFQSLDYRLVQPSATNLLIGTSYDPTLPISSQLTAYPVGL